MTPSTRLLCLALVITAVACSSATEPDPNSPLPLIEDLGITIAPFDAASNTAGDISFDGGSTFIPFGKLIEGTNGLKRTPELTFYVEVGTQVRAPVTGTVSQIDVLYSDDYLIVIQQPGSDWEVGVEHVVDPLVQVGDEVTAGQVIATATPEDTPLGPIAFTELAVWLPTNVDETMVKKCPYLAFDEELRASFTEQIYALATSWEAEWGEDVFDESSWVLPGCVIEELTEAEARNPSG